MCRTYNLKANIKPLIYELKKKQYSITYTDRLETDGVLTTTSELKEHNSTLQDQLSKLKYKLIEMNKENDKLKFDINTISRNIKQSNVSILVKFLRRNIQSSFLNV